MLMQRSSDTEKNPTMKFDKAALHVTRSVPLPSPTAYGRSGDDSAFITDYKTTSVALAGRGESSEERHLVDAVQLRFRDMQSPSRILQETISEEFSLDSGIEMMSGKLRKLVALYSSVSSSWSDMLSLCTLY